MINWNERRSEKMYPDAWIQTYTGKAFWPYEPDVDLICIEDIAWALSHQARYVGHCDRFYSVAEHSMCVAHAVLQKELKRRREASPMLSGVTESGLLREKNVLIKWALLHDATEAYMIDVPKPLKDTLHLSAYKLAEAKLMKAIAQKFGLPEEIPEEVKTVDYLILEDERRALMKSPPMPWNTASSGCGMEKEIKNGSFFHESSSKACGLFLFQFSQFSAE